MQYYSGKEPNLVGTAFTNTVNKIMKKKHGGTISDNISMSFTNFYNNYISDNLFLILLIILFIILLVYRYYYVQTTRKEKPEQKEDNLDKELFGNQSTNENVEKFHNQDYNLIRDITETQTSHLKYDPQPSFNPIYPVNQQKEQVYYPPDPLPINIPESGIVYTRDIYQEPKNYSPLNSTNYDYFNVYTNPTRSYYAGTENTYKEPAGTDIVNALGFSTDFNGDTAKFIYPVTELNKKSVVDLEKIIDQNNNNLVDALRFGPKVIESANTKYGIEPPYADD